jgi:geranylgeranylglycerol-phosphate geranylgeranyltransferase
MSYLETIRGLSRLVRLRTTLSAPVMTAAGASGVSSQASFSAHALACLASFSAIACAQAFNDVCDASLDALTKPWRPIPSGKVSLISATVTVLVLSFLATVFALLVSLVALAVNVTVQMLGMIYSLRLKSTVLVGNIAVSIAAAFTTLYLLATAKNPLNAVPIFALTFFYVLGNEIFLTVLDRSGDHRMNVRTLATVFPLRVSAHVLALCSVGLCISAAFQTAIHHTNPSTTVTFFLIAVSVIISTRIMYSSSNKDHDEILRKAHIVWKLAWVPGMLVLILW